MDLLLGEGHPAIKEVRAWGWGCGLRAAARTDLPLGEGGPSRRQGGGGPGLMGWDWGLTYVGYIEGRQWTCSKARSVMMKLTVWRDLVRTGLLLASCG